MNVQHIRADEVHVGDVMLIPAVGGNTVNIGHVSVISLVGDDVEFNGFLTTSRSNLVTVIAR